MGYNLGVMAIAFPRFCHDVTGLSFCTGSGYLPVEIFIANSGQTGNKRYRLLSSSLSGFIVLAIADWCSGMSACCTADPIVR